MRLLRNICIVVISTTVNAVAQEPVTPRYHAAIGVKLHSTLPWFAGAYTCELGEGEIGKYRYNSEIKGPVVAHVHQGYPAYEAGITCGDIITEVDGQSTAEEGSLQKYIFARKPGDSVTLTLMRPHSEKVDPDGIIHVLHSSGKITLKLRAQDWLVTLRSRILPDRTSYYRGDLHGPHYSLNYTTRYSESEARPGDVSHACHLTLDGDIDRIEIESPYLDLMGVRGGTYRLARGQLGNLLVSGPIARIGIPVLTRVPISYRIPVWDEHALRLTESDDGIKDPKDGKWYVKTKVTLECWLPETHAREVAKREKEKLKDKN